MGVNLSPTDGKICSFDCLYCEAGYNAQGPGTTGFPSRENVRTQLEQKLIDMQHQGTLPDTITFSGNGEPTLHPQFAQVIADTLQLRDHICPSAKVSVLSNATRLADPNVVQALQLVDNNILKLDSAIPSTMRQLDRPTNPAFNPAEVIRMIADAGSNVTVQTMLLRGTLPDGTTLDNTTPHELQALQQAYLKIRPRHIMLYSIDRPTPYALLHKVEHSELESIADRIRALGLNVTTA